MATDERTEALISAALRRYLGAAVGPDGTWSEARASRVLAGPELEQPRSRRWPLLLAAALTVALVAGAVLASNGLNRPSQPVLVPPGPASAAPTATPVDASPSPATIFVNQTPSDPPPPCHSDWSSKGTAPAKGLMDGIRVVRLDGEGHLLMVFGHPLDTVRQISIAPTQPPFVTSKGKSVTVAGTSFLKLTISGLNRSTPAPDRTVIGDFHGPGSLIVQAPITEIRRIKTPVYSSPLKDPPEAGSTEVWIIGLDYTPCVRVRTVHEEGYGSDDPGDNTLLVDFDRPRPSESPH